MTIAITGGTGFVGQAVLDEAGRRGLKVKALTRRDQAEREGVEWVRGDLHDEAALKELVSGASSIMHIAGVVNAADMAGFQHGNVAGTRNLLQAAMSVGRARFTCVSSLAAREPGLSDYGHSKRAAEELVQQSTLDWTILRPPAIYGPRDTEMLELFRAARWGVMPMPPSGRASMIHVHDLAHLLLESTPGADAAWSAKVFEPDDLREGGWTHAELARAIASAVGRRSVWAPSLPAGVIKAGARLDRLIRGAKAKLTPDRARYMVHPDWVSRREMAVPTALWMPQIETQEGLRQTAVWYAKNGWIAGLKG